MRIGIFPKYMSSMYQESYMYESRFTTQINVVVLHHGDVMAD